MNEKLQPFNSSQTSALLFIMAKQAAKRAQEMTGSIGAKYEAMTAVVLCVIVAEAGINEIGEWFELHHLRPPFSVPHDLPYGFEGMELRLKWSLLPITVRQKAFDRSAEPWQSFHALVELRNAIVHLRNRPLTNATAGLLKAKDLVSDQDDLNFKVASWACNTMVDMFMMLTEFIDPPKESIDLTWRWTQRAFPYLD